MKELTQFEIEELIWDNIWVNSGGGCCSSWTELEDVDICAQEIWKAIYE